MKKVLSKLLFCTVVSLIVLSLMGCPQEEESGLSAQEVQNAAMATILTGNTSIDTFFSFSDNGAAAVEAQYPGLDITEGSSTVTFSYTNVDIDLDDDSTTDIIVSGTFVVSDNGATITFTSMNIVNAANASETYIINGNLTLSGSNPRIVTSTLSISGSLVSATHNIATVMTMPSSGTPEFTAATINGDNYLIEFNAAIANM